VHPGFRGLEALAVGPDLPGEDDLFARLGGDGFAEVGVFAVGDKVFPGFDDFQAAVGLEDAGAVFGPSAVVVSRPCARRGRG